MRSAKDLHTAVILFTAEAYMTKAIEEGLTSDSYHILISSKLKSWRVFRRLSQEESKLVQGIGDDPYMEKLKKEEISFVVYSLEMLKLWEADSSYGDSIGISKKKLRLGRAHFVKGMLELKNRDHEKYKKIRAVIDDTILNAKKFYSYTYEKINEEISKKT